MATKTSRIQRNLNFLGETAFLGGIFSLEYPNRRSEKVNCHFLNYRLSFRKLQIFISQTTGFHFANYRFSFRFVSFCFAPFRFANYSQPRLRPEATMSSQFYLKWNKNVLILETIEITHSSYLRGLIYVFQKSELKKKCPIFAGLSIEKLSPSTSILVTAWKLNFDSILFWMRVWAWFSVEHA